jgi:acetyl esterase/lipase
VGAWSVAACVVVVAGDSVGAHYALLLGGLSTLNVCAAAAQAKEAELAESALSSSA